VSAKGWQNVYAASAIGTLLGLVAEALFMGCLLVLFGLGAVAALLVIAGVWRSERGGWELWVGVLAAPPLFFVVARSAVRTVLDRVRPLKVHQGRVDELGQVRVMGRTRSFRVPALRCAGEERPWVVPRRVHSRIKIGQTVRVTYTALSRTVRRIDVRSR
jgi:hypothetical protein